MKNDRSVNDTRLKNEIEHGKYLSVNNAGEIWGWETPAGKIRWQRRVNMLTDGITPDMNVLEIGCGSGYFSKELLKTKAKITSIDISPDLLEIAKKNYQAENIFFLIENAYSMSFADSQFDYVVGSSVLHHLEIQKAFQEIYRVLKPGGKILFTEPNMLNPQIALQKNIPFIKRKLGDSPDETAFIKWSLKRDLKNAGFSNIVITPFDWLHPKTPESLIALIKRTGSLFEKIPFLKEIAGSHYIVAQKY